MGNKYSDEFVPEKNIDIGGKKYEPNDFEKLNEKLKIFEKAKTLNFIFDENSNKNTNIRNNFNNKYEQYLDINRFAIPIIGAISSGKSTFLNNFLNLNNILQIGELVTTKFITIIRHDKNAEIPELYHVELERRFGENRFNFKEKGECILKSKNYEEIGKEIKKLNEDIKISNQTNSEKYLYDIEKYFLIIRIKIPIFEGEFEEYGNLIDFMDIPGLDEKTNSDIDNFDDFINIIFPNILFPIFIFDILKFANDDSKDVVIKYFNLYTHIINDLNYKGNEIEYGKSVYLLNKIDVIGKKFNEINDIFENFKAIYGKLNLDNGKIIDIQVEQNYNWFGISANKLHLNINGAFIDKLLAGIENQAKHTEKNAFKSFIKEYLQTNYNIDIREAKSEIEDNTLKENLNIVNERLRKSCGFLSNPKLTLKELTFIFKFKDKFSNKEEEEINKKLINKICKNIKDQLDNYLYFNIEGLMPKIDMKKIEEKKNLIKHNNKYNNIIQFNKKICSLFPSEIVEKYDNINELIEKIKIFNNFYDNNNIRILFIGMISSGKTSLLNSIIGNNYNILQTTVKECTKCIYRIKYSKDIRFCESKIIENENGSYFKDIKGTEINDITQIKNKIQNLNIESKFKAYTLYIPIEGLEPFKFKENIELIDLPGIKKEIAELKIDLKKLINMSDGFIFNFNSLNIADENSQYIFTEIITDIKDKNQQTFNFENCLFNLNFIDQIEENLINEKVKEFKKNLSTTINTKIFTGNFIEKLALKNRILSSTNINVSYFSNLYYNQYQKNANYILSLEFITNDKLEEIYENIIEDYDEEEIEKLILENENDNLFKKDLEQKISLIKKKSSDDNNEYILKIAKFLVIFEKYKNKLIKKYEYSKAQIFFQKFKNQINSSYNNNKDKISLKLNIFLIDILFRLFYYDELCHNQGNLEFKKKNIRIKKSIIEKEYKRIVEVIKNKYLAKKKIIEEDYKVNAIKELENEKHHTPNEIKIRLKQLGYEGKITNLFNSFYNNELKNISFDFIIFCINEISDLLSVDSFQKIISVISDNFSDEIKNSAWSKGLVYSSILSAYALGFSSTLVGGPFIIGLGLGYLLMPIVLFGFLKYKEWKNDTNKHKVEVYFDSLIKEFNKNEDSFIKSIGVKKDEFIEKLEKTDEINSQEIVDLKNANYEKNFQILMEELNQN